MAQAQYAACDGRRVISTEAVRDDTYLFGLSVACGDKFSPSELKQATGDQAPATTPEIG